MAESPRVWNLPNTITGARILLAPVCIVLLFVDAGRDGPARWWSAGVFLVAMASDGVDGAIARRRNQITDLGKLLDPIADKVATSGVLVSLGILGEVWWVVVLPIVVREVGITVWRMFAAHAGHIMPAGGGGKLKTVAQVVALTLALAPFWVLWGSWVHPVVWVLLGIALLLTVWSGLAYVWSAWQMSRRARGGAAS